MEHELRSLPASTPGAAEKDSSSIQIMIKAGHKILENGISMQHKDSFEFFIFSLANHDVKRTQMRALVPQQNLRLETNFESSYMFSMETKTDTVIQQCFRCISNFADKKGGRSPWGRIRVIRPYKSVRMHSLEYIITCKMLTASGSISLRNCFLRQNIDDIWEIAKIFDTTT